ncbi:hypothetical protein [Methylosinus sp. Ce-a6]|uniref:hypothetical protein n=1 Tax=Methylosinus sp. Ce-a6 TaxID=2172005 RepID=UPI00135C6A28|nr:hypothetical protein [Methylosinus sp. Ce-a6]
MLMKTPSALLRLRSETRVRVTLAPVRPAPAKKLPRHRREAIVDLVAALMRWAEPTAFAIEGPARAAIRARLCEAGWKWGRADAAADDAVQAALARVGAERPTWKQGQPEWTQEAVLPIEREHCVRCRKPIPEGSSKFCGSICRMAAKVDRNRRQDKDERYAKEKIYRAAWAEKQHPRACKICGTEFKPKHVREWCCSRACGADARRLARRGVRVVCEGL